MGENEGQRWVVEGSCQLVASHGKCPVPGTNGVYAPFTKETNHIRKNKTLEEYCIVCDSETTKQKGTDRTAATQPPHRSVPVHHVPFSCKSVSQKLIVFAPQHMAPMVSVSQCMSP